MVASISRPSPVSANPGDRRAIVTGGSAGIGAAIVTRLIADGGSVHVIDSTPAPMPEVSSTEAESAMQYPWR